MGARHGGATAGAVAVAVAWTLCPPAVTGAIVGFRTAAQVNGIIGAATITLADEDVREIWAEAPARPVA